MHHRTLLRSLALLLIVLVATAPCALADFGAYVSAGSMGVYADSALTTRIGALPKNSVVVVRSHAGGAAKIEFMGRTGYASTSDMQSVGGDAEDAVVAQNTRVYQKPSTKSAYASLKKGTSVRLLSTSGSRAMIEMNGYIGYTNRAHLSLKGEAAAPATPDANTGTDDIVVESFSATVSAATLAVHKDASSSSRKLGTLKQGANVTVRAYDDTWACLENAGSYGFALRSGLSRGPIEIPTVPDSPSTGSGGGSSSGSSLEKDIVDGKYSNEEAIFLFLTRKMGLNAAAAAGILSNIKSESTFRPTAYNASGGSYGICQWTGGRFTRLKNYCADKGYDYTSLIGQLYFLEYELENHYSSVLKHMRGVENSADGAYDAGHYWCYNFEIPANRASVSVKRGNTARDTYWPKYA